MIRAAALLESLMREMGIEEEIRLTRIKKTWPTIFRAPLPQHMAPSKLSGEELSINVDSPIWMQQLRFYEGEITEKLRSYGVKTVRFRLGKVGKPATEKPSSFPGRKLSPDENIFISETISSISDAEIRESVRRVMEKHLTRGKKS